MFFLLNPVVEQSCCLMAWRNIWWLFQASLNPVSISALCAFKTLQWVPVPSALFPTIPSLTPVWWSLRTTEMLSFFWSLWSSIFIRCWWLLALNHFCCHVGSRFPFFKKPQTWWCHGSLTRHEGVEENFPNPPQVTERKNQGSCMNVWI